MRRKLIALRTRNELAIETGSGSTILRYEYSSDTDIASFSKGTVTVNVLPGKSEERELVENKLKQILAKDPHAFKAPYELTSLIEHIIYTHRTKSIEKEVNRLFKEAIKARELETGRQVLLTTHRRRGGGDPSTNVRGEKIRIEFKLRKPVDFATEYNDREQRPDFDIGSKRPYIAFFLHAMPNDFSDFGKGLREFDRTFRFVSSTTVEQRVIDNISYHINNGISFSLTLGPAIRKCDFRLFVTSLVEEIDLITQGRDYLGLEEHIKNVRQSSQDNYW